MAEIPLSLAVALGEVAMAAQATSESAVSQPFARTITVGKVELRWLQRALRELRAARNPGVPEHEATDPEVVLPPALES